MIYLHIFTGTTIHEDHVKSEVTSEIPLSSARPTVPSAVTMLSKHAISSKITDAEGTDLALLQTDIPSAFPSTVLGQSEPLTSIEQRSGILNTTVYDLYEKSTHIVADTQLPDISQTSFITSEIKSGKSF